jgi:hypothetical protein
MRRRKPTLPSSTPDESRASERGPERAWSLVETLDGYAVEELTPTQAARLLRKRGARRLEPQAPEHASGQSLRTQAQGRQLHRLGRSPSRTGGPPQKDDEGGASDGNEERVFIDRRSAPACGGPNRARLRSAKVTRPCRACTWTVPTRLSARRAASKLSG